MERCLEMKEEKVTKIILNWLKTNGWEIVCYDFPQSGTGILLHPNGKNRTTKNKGGIIPDIIVVKNDIALFFENKDRFYQPDFDKLEEVREQQNYTEALSKLLVGYNIKAIRYGIAIPCLEKEIEKSRPHFQKIDFFMTAKPNKEITLEYDVFNVFKKENK